MGAPSVSVLVTAYQAEQHLEVCLRSVLRQSFGELELVVVDDGSTDRTGQIIAAHADADGRVRPLPLAANRGPGAARNAGLALCRGDWVALLDADDAFMPERLGRLLDCAEATGAGMVADNLMLASYPGLAPQGAAFGQRNLPAALRISLADYASNNDFSAARYSYGYLKPMVRRRLLVENRLSFREDLAVCEDFHFHLDCLLAGADWRMIAEPLYLYALRPGSLSRALTPEKLEVVLAHSRRQLEDPRLPPDVRAALESRHARITRLQAYLRFRREVEERRLSAALSRAVRNPAVLGPGVAALWRRGMAHCGMR